jgi:MmgE/PrpD N-terminal domain/MmgE/PrpD C-terminal domain
VTICEDIGRWAAGLDHAVLSETVAGRARLQRASQLAARSAGADDAAPIAAVAPPGPIGEIYRDAAASIAHDWDDYLFMGHTGHSSVWAAEAFCADRGRALLAQVAANEVAGRVGAALVLGPHNGQFWASIHCAGAAVAASVGLGLDADRTAHAVAIALYQPPYGLWPGFMGPDSKLLTAAEPAAQGARAALLAAEGMTGALDVIEHRRGLLAHLSFAPRPAMLGALGRVWLTDTLAYKRLPGCAYLQSAAEAALAAEVSASDVAAIDVEAGRVTCGMEELGRGSDLTPVRVNFSTALSVAIALLAGRLTPEELRPDALAERATALRGLAGRIRVRHDAELTARTLRGMVDAGAWPAEVPPRGWLRVRRRARELGMDEAALDAAALRELLRAPGMVGTLISAISRRGGGERGIARLDTGAMRMTFPCRLRIRLRSGRTLEVEGDEPGSCGRPLDEQSDVVSEKCRVAGVEERALLHAS